MKKQLLSLLLVVTTSLTLIACAGTGSSRISSSEANASSGNPKVYYADKSLNGTVIINNGVSTMRGTDGYRQVTVNFYNSSKTQSQTINVETNFYDANGKVVETSQSAQFNIAPGKSAFYKANADAHGVKDYMIFVR